MEIDWFFRASLIILCLGLSAFFAGSEVALFSLDKKKIPQSFSNAQLVQNYLKKLLDSPRRLLVTILIGNTVVNVLASIIAVSLAIDLADIWGIPKNYALTVQIILLTILILLFSEILPKIIASKEPIKFSRAAAFPLYWISAIIFPVAEFISEIIKLFVSKIKIDKKKTVIMNEEIKELASLSLEEGAIQNGEHDLIHSIVDFKSITVGDVMTPRVDMIAVSSDTEFSEVMSLITKSGRSRIPLYRDDFDDIIGIIYAKDLLPYFKNPELRKNLSLSKISRKAMFVPKTKLIVDLMREFQEKKMHIAIVVDEYGGTAGLVSLEDIIEEIIGEIRDEYDKEENLITKTSDGKFIVLGTLSIDDLKDLLQLNLNTEELDFDTIAGLILDHAGEIPQENYSFDYENYKFTVKEVSNKRIKKVLIEKS